MKKFLVSILLIAFLSFASCLFFDWWTIAIVAFGVSIFIQQSKLKSFLAGFLALFLLWSILSFSLSSQNNHLLASKVSLLIIKSNNPYALILITGFIGGIVAGFSALTGAFIKPKRSQKMNMD